MQTIHPSLFARPPFLLGTSVIQGPEPVLPAEGSKRMGNEGSPFPERTSEIIASRFFMIELRKKETQRGTPGTPNLTESKRCFRSALPPRTPHASQALGSVPGIQTCRGPCPLGKHTCKQILVLDVSSFLEWALEACKARSSWETIHLPIQEFVWSRRRLLSRHCVRPRRCD